MDKNTGEFVKFFLDTHPRENIWIYPWLSYGANQHLCPYLFNVDVQIWPVKFHRLAEVQTPSATCIMAESDNYMVGETLPLGFWEPRHGGTKRLINGEVEKQEWTSGYPWYYFDESILWRDTINALFIDGHAAILDWPLPLLPLVYRHDFRYRWQ